MEGFQWLIDKMDERGEEIEFEEMEVERRRKGPGFMNFFDDFDGV